MTVFFILLLSVVNCQSMTTFEHDRFLSNNSFIWYHDIDDGDYPLKCVTDSVNCCNDTGNWTDWTGTPVEEGVNGTSCLYVTRGDGVISLHRKRGCTDHVPGLWRCDIPDSSGEIQSLYIYISDKRSHGELITLFCATLYSTGIQEN